MDNNLCETLCRNVTGSSSGTSQLLTIGIGILFLISEVMGMTTRIPQNSVLQLVFDSIRQITAPK